MRRRSALAVTTLAATAVAGTALGGPVLAGSDDDRDKNTLLAEALFQLFLVDAGFEPSDITCTRPPLRDIAGDLLCYALITDRVTVAAIARLESPGEYTFQPLNKIDPADLESGVPGVAPSTSVPEPPPEADEPSTEPTQPADEPSTEPTQPADTAEPPSTEQGDANDAIQASIDSAMADAEGLGQVLTDNHPSIRSVERIAYHAPTSTVQVVVTTNESDPAARHSVAFFITDVMAFLWMEDEPSRRPDATIHPRLEVTVDGMIYGTPFDVMTAVADYTITEQQWIEVVTENAPQLQPAGTKEHRPKLHAAGAL